MTEITLIRHGQANSGARSEEDHDRLSELGRRQTAWLGEHLLSIGGFDRVIPGTLRRKEETAVLVNRGGRPHRRHARLNELDCLRLSHALEARDGIPFPIDATSFAAHVPRVLELWRAGHAGTDHESCDTFRDRVLGAIHDAATEGPGAVLVTSTGVIATLCALARGLDTVVKARMCLRILNTSVHRFEIGGEGLHLTQFGATPHLDHRDRHAARTHH